MTEIVATDRFATDGFVADSFRPDSSGGEGRVVATQSAYSEYTMTANPTTVSALSIVNAMSRDSASA